MTCTNVMINPSYLTLDDFFPVVTPIGINNFMVVWGHATWGHNDNYAGIFG